MQRARPASIRMQGKTYKQIMPKHHLHYSRERCKESRLRQELRERREKAALEGTADVLGDLRTGNALASDAVPE